MQDKYAVKRLIEDEHSPILFEIGSADGIDTNEFVTAFSGLNFKIYCFEPDGRNINSFKNRVNSENVKLFEGVVGDRNGKVRFYTSTTSLDGKVDLIYSSSLRPPGPETFKVPEWAVFFQSEENWSPTTVKSVTLDSFVSKNKIPYISYVYMDVQGAEDIVINGGRNTFDKKVRYLYTEYSNTPYYLGQPNLEQILELLPSYEILIDFKTDVLLRNKEFTYNDN